MVQGAGEQRRLGSGMKHARCMVCTAAERGENALTGSKDFHPNAMTRIRSVLIDRVGQRRRGQSNECTAPISWCTRNIFDLCKDDFRMISVTRDETLVAGGDYTVEVKVFVASYIRGSSDHMCTT